MLRRTRWHTVRSSQLVLNIREQLRLHSTVSPHIPPPHDDQTTQSRLRTLLRESAQPVAVITARLGIESGTLDQNKSDAHTGIEGECKFKLHGATLSSFTSIAMDPHPLVAFSLRLPSRMSTALKEGLTMISPWGPGMVVNILSAAQEHVAVQFASPELHPEPFASIAYSWTRDGLPVLDGCLGALSCIPIACWPLNNLETLAGRPFSEDLTSLPENDKHGVNGGTLSELFVAKVVRVEKAPAAQDAVPISDERTLPLIYHRKRYATTRALELNTHPKRG